MQGFSWKKVVVTCLQPGPRVSRAGGGILRFLGQLAVSQQFQITTVSPNADQLLHSAVVFTYFLFQIVVGILAFYHQVFIS